MAIHSSILTWRSPWTEEPGGPHFVCVLVPTSGPTLCGPMDCSPPGSSVHGILQARILEWVAIPSPGDLPDPGIKPGQILYHLSHQRSPVPDLILVWVLSF